MASGLAGVVSTRQITLTTRCRFLLVLATLAQAASPAHTTTAATLSVITLAPHQARRLVIVARIRGLAVELFPHNGATWVAAPNLDPDANGAYA